MAYGDFKDLARMAASHKVLKNKAINIAKNPKYESWLLRFTIFLIKRPLQLVVLIIMRLNKIYNYPKNYINQLLKTKKNSSFKVQRQYLGC